MAKQRLGRGKLFSPKIQLKTIHSPRWVLKEKRKKKKKGSVNQVVEKEPGGEKTPRRTETRAFQEWQGGKGKWMDAVPRNRKRG